MNRQRYFETRSRMITALSLIFSSAAVAVFTESATYSGFSLAQWFAATVAFLQAWELVISSSSLAIKHDSLRRSHIHLETDLRTYGDSLTLAEEAKLIEKRHNIEVDEPPIIRSLQVLCRNKVAIANGAKCEEKLWWGANWFTTQIFR